MKRREEILKSLGQTEEDRLLLAGVLDKWENCLERDYQTHTRFLDLRQCDLVCKVARLIETDVVFVGGYAEAERKVAVFYPPYETVQDVYENPPIRLLRAKKYAQDSLTHRDYLGALMGLQIDRAMIGDILVHEAGADIFVLSSIANFIITNFICAGKRRINLSEVPLTELRYSHSQEVKGEGTVASSRLDSVIALIFHLSRGEAQTYIANGRAFLNDQLCVKPEREISTADRITVRGLGRARVTDAGGISKKGRLFIKYVRNS